MHTYIHMFEDETTEEVVEATVEETTEEVASEGTEGEEAVAPTEEVA